MKILIVTPLYPPDIASHAPYVKDLASRLKESHDITILTYNHIPEKIDGVTIYTIQKRLAIPHRVLLFTLALFKLAKTHDVVYLQNGPSVELPMLLVSRIRKIPLVLRNGDPQVANFIKTHSWYKKLHRAILKRSRQIISHVEDMNGTCVLTKEATVLTKPEILPFEPSPSLKITQYEESWKKHVSTLNSLFTQIV